VINDLITATGCRLVALQIKCDGEYVVVPVPDGYYWVPGGMSQTFGSASEAMEWFADASAAGCNNSTTMCTGSPTQVVQVNEALWRFAVLYSNRFYKSGAQWIPQSDVVIGSDIPVTRLNGSHNETRCEFALQPDGTCVLIPTESEFAQRAQDKVAVGAKLGPAAAELDLREVPYDTSSPDVLGPAGIAGGRQSSETTSDGGWRTVDRTYDATYSPPGTLAPYVQIMPRDTVTTGPGTTTPAPYVAPTPYDPGTGVGGDPGQPVVPPGAQPGGSSTTVEVETCGLPSTAPCKIDESGTPPPPTVDPTADAAGAFQAMKACVLTPSSCLPALPSLNWAFTFPTGCGVIPTPAFSPWLEGIDLCPYQPTIHDLMSLVWVVGGLFGALRMVFNDSTSGG